MTDEELDLNLGEDNSEEIISRKNKKINSLSERIKEKEETLTQEAEARKKAEEEREALSKERDFYKGFNQMSSKYKGASDFQDAILEKVRAGYDIEDATVSVLAKEGKLSSQESTPPPPEKEMVAGGSASTNLPAGQKSTGEMTQEEKRAALMDAEAQGEFRF